MVWLLFSVIQYLNDVSRLLASISEVQTEKKRNITADLCQNSLLENELSSVSLSSLQWVPEGFFSLGRMDGKGEDLWHSGPIKLSPFSATTTLVVFELP